jgi:hypothetical protein
VNDRRFPVLQPQTRADAARAIAAGTPRDVPWSLLAPHEQRALDNHDQTLERLAERGGLAPCEMLAIIENRRWRSMPLEDAIDLLKAVVDAHEREKVGGDS